jgi:DNA polymerase I-like protein with 3'-5' exonuclease and polymerase domains
MPRVTLQELRELVPIFKTQPVAFDYETTGLDERTARPFMVSFAWGDNQTASYFFDGSYEEKIVMQTICHTSKVLLAHNAKFEMRFTEQHFGPIDWCPIWDTMVFDRVVYNDHMSYSLDNCAKRAGLAKIEIKKYMDERKLFTRHPDGEKEYHFDQCPQEIIIPYCENDSLVSLQLYKNQRDVFRQWDQSERPIKQVINLELRVTKVLYEMERRGLLLDEQYCLRAIDHEDRIIKDSLLHFKSITGQSFTDSAKFLAPILRERGVEIGITEKGAESVAVETLEKTQDELAKTILNYRRAAKRRETYFQNFMSLVSTDGRIHPSIFQTGAASFRFSVRDPSCQNWPDEWDDKKKEYLTPYPVRRAFIAEEGCKIASLDYSQMELRLMADEADEVGMIEAFKDGTDFHQQTADLAGVPRGVAKCIAKDSMVLTHRGLVKIQDIHWADKIWDGVEFVCHEGVLSRGTQGVMEYDGVRGTKDHRVFTQCGRIVPLETAWANGYRLALTANGAQRVRLTVNKWAYLSRWLVSKTNCFVQRLRGDFFGTRGQPAIWKDDDVQVPNGEAARHEREYLCGERRVHSHEAALRKFTVRYLQKLWRTWYSCAFLFRRISGVVLEKFARVQENIRGQDRQQRGLFAGQHTDCVCGSAEQEQTNDETCRISWPNGSSVRLWKTRKGRLPGDAALRGAHRESCEYGPYARRDIKQATSSQGKVQEEVFDIINCGPRRRFTVNGRCVKNSGRFAKLYGAGIRKVSTTLGISYEIAEKACRAIDSMSPKIARYTRELIRYAEQAPYCTNWLGRRYHFDRKWAYKFPNYRIQGGCSEIMRIALCDVHDFLKENATGNTYIIMVIHDEIVLNIAECDMHLLPEVKRLMIAAYRSKKNLDMDVSCAVGVNFADIEPVRI